MSGLNDLSPRCQINRTKSNVLYTYTHNFSCTDDVISLVQYNFPFKITLRRNGTPPLFDVLPFEINKENYFLLIGFI